MRPDILAVDFGTSNTHLCRCSADEPLPSPVSLDRNNRPGIPTALLYRPDGTILIGHEALEEWGETPPSLRRDLRLRVHFKPDLLGNPQCEEDARLFLGALYSRCAATFLRTPEETATLFGVPGAASPGYRAALRQLASEAGFPDVSLLAEPWGAILYHLNRRDLSLTLREATRSVLVVDFGGGTCDFALLLRGNIVSSWGDMLLGGRLFDDLFFQWYLEQQPDKREELAASGDDYIVHWHWCRECKERFSTFLASQREQGRDAISWSAPVGPGGLYGRLKNLTEGAFRERAASYTPSQEFLERLRASEEPQESALADLCNTDLFARFRKALLEGLEGGPGITAVDKVILTGGSSLWPFLPSLVAETLALPPERIVTSERPYANVAEGLSLYPALRRRNNDIKERLYRGLPSFLATLEKTLLAERIRDLETRICRLTEERLFAKRLRPLLEEFRTEGGSVANLEKRLQRTAEEFAPSLQSIVEKALEEGFSGLDTAVRGAARDWFRREGVAYVPEELLDTEELSSERVAGIHAQMNVGKLGSGYVELATLATVILTATACGGGGTALLLSGPLGLVLGALLGIFLAMAGKKAGKNLPIPGLLTRHFLSEKTIDTCLDDAKQSFRATLSSRIDEELLPMKEALRRRLDEALREIIDSLSLLHQIGEEKMPLR
jgi:hypothetical protein